RSPESRAPGVGVLAERGRIAARDRAELLRRLGERRDGTGADLLAVEQFEPLGQRAFAQSLLELRELRRERVEPGQADELEEALPEARLECGDRQVATVGALVEPVAGGRAGEEPRGGQAMRLVRHRDLEPRAFAAALPLEE